MRKYLMLLFGLLFFVNTSFASDITWSDKVADDGIAPVEATELVSSSDLNEVKTAVNSKLDTVATLAELIALPIPADGTIVHVAGRTTAGDGYEGDFRWDSTPCVASVTADTQKGITAAPSASPTGSAGAWWRMYDGPINVKWFGAVGDGTSDDTAALLAVLDYQVPAIVPIGIYRTTAPLVFKNGSKLLGLGNYSGVDTLTVYPTEMYAHNSVIKYDGPSGDDVAVIVVSDEAVGVEPTNTATRNMINVGMSNIVIDGSDKAGIGVYLVRALMNNQFDYITVTGCRAHAFLAMVCFGGNVNNWTAFLNRGCGITLGKNVYGWAAYGVDQSVFTSCWAFRNGCDPSRNYVSVFDDAAPDVAYGIGLYTGRAVKLINAQCTYNGGVGIYTETNRWPITIDGGFIEFSCYSLNGASIPAGSSGKRWGIWVQGVTGGVSRHIRFADIHMTGPTSNLDRVRLTGIEPSRDGEDAVLFERLPLLYEIDADWSNYRLTDCDSTVVFLGEKPTVGWIEVSTLAKLIALPIPADGTIVHVAGRTTAGDGYEGDFRWDSTPCVASVTADTQKGITVAPSTATTGASGAWWRMYSGESVNALWFGIDRTGTSDSYAKIMAMLAVQKNDNFFPEGNYLTSAAIAVTKANQKIRGAGRSVTTITGTSTSATVVYFHPSAPSAGDEFLTNCGISDLSITNSNTTSTGIALRLYQCSGFLLDNVSIGMHLKAISVEGGQLNQLTNFVLSCSGYTGSTITTTGLLAFIPAVESDGVTYQAPFTCQVSSFSIGGATIATNNIYITAGDCISISNGYVSWAATNLVKIDEASASGSKVSSVMLGPDLVLDGVNTPMTDYGIYIPDSANQSMLLKINGCIIGQTDYGIYGGTGVGTISVSGTEFVNIPNDAISLAGSASALDVSITGNALGGIATADNMSGIKIAGANRVVIAGNKISGATGTGSAGINLSGTITVATVDGNLVNTCTTDLINTATITRYVQSGNTSNCTTKILNGEIVGNVENTVATALDWYLESTFTPAISIGGSTTGITYTTQVGKYTRIGNLCFFNLSIVLSSKGAETGNVLITGLPLTAQNSINFPCSVFGTALAANVLDQGLYGRVVINSTTIRVDQGETSGSVSQLTNADLTNTTTLGVSGSFVAQ